MERLKNETAGQDAQDVRVVGIGSDWEMTQLGATGAGLVAIPHPNAWCTQSTTSRTSRGTHTRRAEHSAAGEMRTTTSFVNAIDGDTRDWRLGWRPTSAVRSNPDLYSDDAAAGWAPLAPHPDVFAPRPTTGPGCRHDGARRP